MTKRVALVLGGGGARGYAHLGVLQVLAERGYQVSAVAGTSIGAVAGGLLATGMVNDYIDWVTGLSQRDVLHLLDPVLPGPGAFRAERLFTKMAEFLGGAMIEDLPIPYTAVATDLGAKREVWFTSGPLDVAIRASIAIPGVLTPIMVNGRLLVDGGVLNPVPMSAVAGADADFTMAVSLSGPREHLADLLPTKASAEQRPVAEWRDRLMQTASEVWEKDVVAWLSSRFGKDHTEPQLKSDYEPAPPGIGLTDVATMALETMGSLITRFQMAATPPDVMVTVPVDAAKVMDFHRANELIALGRHLAQDALDRAFPS